MRAFLASTAAFAALALVTIAFAQSATDKFVIYPNQAACLARSQAQCSAMHCDGTFTRYWWACVGPLTNGTAGASVVTNGSYALDIQASGPYSANVTLSAIHVTAGLNATETAKAVTYTQVNALLPGTNATNGSVAAP